MEMNILESAATVALKLAMTAAILVGIVSKIRKALPKKAKHTHTQSSKLAASRLASLLASLLVLLWLWGMFLLLPSEDPRSFPVMLALAVIVVLHPSR